MAASTLGGSLTCTLLAGGCTARSRRTGGIRLRAATRLTVIAEDRRFAACLGTGTGRRRTTALRSILSSTLRASRITASGSACR
ncbi:MAG TPA: hypothetical protein VNQ81_09735 [Povalibacter sp.]|nr:hypothetical protein [Povalibacter sp.]